MDSSPGLAPGVGSDPPRGGLPGEVGLGGDTGGRPGRPGRPKGGRKPWPGN